MEEIDIYRTANILLKQYIGRAHGIALQRSYSFEQQSDYVAASVWQKIAEAVSWLQSSDAPMSKDKAH